MYQSVVCSNMQSQKCSSSVLLMRSYKNKTQCYSPQSNKFMVNHICICASCLCSTFIFVYHVACSACHELLILFVFTFHVLLCLLPICLCHLSAVFLIVLLLCFLVLTSTNVHSKQTCLLFFACVLLSCAHTFMFVYYIISCGYALLFPPLLLLLQRFAEFFTPFSPRLHFY